MLGYEMHFLLITTLLLAQPSHPSVRQMSPVDTLEIDASQTDTSQTPLKMPTDTGRMAWGRKDFTRYDALSCDRAAFGEWFYFGRTRTQDSILRQPDHDTIPQHVTTAAQTCGSQLRVGNTPDMQLWGMFRLALIARRDNELEEIVTRKMSLAQTIPEKAYTLVTAVDMLMNARPARLTLVYRLMAQLDSLGPEAKLYQYHARSLILRYWFARWQRDSIIRQAEAMIARHQALESADRAQASPVEPFVRLLLVADLDGDVARQDSIINRALDVLGTWESGQATTFISSFSAALTYRKQLYNKPTRPIDGAYWFNHGGIQQPAPGKISLLVSIEHTRGAAQSSLYALIRALHKRYGDELVITLITETRGYAIGTGPLEPADEAKRVAWYFLDYLKLPVTVLVDQAPYDIRPDGRRVYMRAPVAEAFGGWNFFSAILTDKSGAIRWFGSLGSSNDEVRLVQAIDRARR